MHRSRNRRIAARIALHAHGTNRNEKTLSYTRNVVVYFRTKTADRKPRPRERVTIEQLRSKTQLAPDRAHFIFVEIRQRFDDAPRIDQLLYSGHAIMMSLDCRRFQGTARFDGVGINRSLTKDPVAVEQPAILYDAFLNPYKVLAYDVALQLGFANMFQRPKELVFAVFDANETEAGKGLTYKIGFAVTHQSGVDIDSANAFRAERTRQSVKATVESTPPETKKKTFRSPTRRRICSSIWRDAESRIPVLSAPADAEDEILENARAFGGVDHLRDGTGHRKVGGSIFDSRRFRRYWWKRWSAKPGGGAVNYIAMRHPDLLVIADTVRESANRHCDQIEDRQAELTLIALADVSAQASVRSVAGHNRYRAPECPPKGTEASILGLESS